MQDLILHGQSFHATAYIKITFSDKYYYYGPNCIFHFVTNPFDIKLFQNPFTKEQK